MPPKLAIFFSKISIMEKNSLRKILIPVFFAVIALIFILIIPGNTIKSGFKDTGGTQAVIENYRDEVEKYAKKYEIPSSYLMSLIMLECSGKKVIEPRYENHIFVKLQKFRDGKIDKFEDLSKDDIKNLSDKELKKLAKSYGPYQIMGYKSIKLGVTVDDLQGKNAIAIGTYWINKEYGDVLREGRFKDAFHLHNTGKEFPQSGESQTFDPQYVENGLYYIRYFSKL